MTAYDTAVLADSPRAYWTLGEPSGTTMNDSSGNGNNGTFSSVTLAATGIGDGATAATFNGSTSFASAALNLSTQNKITFEFWLKVTSWLTGDQLAAEFTANTNTNTGSFFANPNSSGHVGSIDFTCGDAGIYNGLHFTQPSAGAWHYYALLFDRTVTNSGGNAAYVDGAVPGLTQDGNALMGDNFANSTMYLMSRAGTTLLCAGTMAKVAVYSGALTSTQVANHYNAQTAVSPAGTPPNRSPFGL